jgi:Domain of unknown function (DUF1905)
VVDRAEAFAEPRDGRPPGPHMGQHAGRAQLAATGTIGGWWPGIVGPSCDAELVVVVFDAELWIWDARRVDSWIFVSLPAAASEEIRDLTGGRRRGFGSLRVRATVGGSTWTTSVFPDSTRDGYVLPIKRDVREAEGLGAGDTATVTVELIDFDH